LNSVEIKKDYQGYWVFEKAKLADSGLIFESFYLLDVQVKLEGESKWLSLGTSFKEFGLGSNVYE
jgi:hypothetical protein